MQQHQSARFTSAWGIVAICLALVGCGANFEGDELAATSEALVTCQGQSCDGFLPSDTTCKNDMVSAGSGALIVNANGVALGGIGLFRSPSCQTVWATTAFYTAGGPRNFRVCAVRKRATDNDSSCMDYTARFGGDSPMKYANSGKAAFGRTVVDGIATRTPDFTVP